MTSTTRPALSLDGEWEFSFEGPSASLGPGAKIRSPGIWQTQFPSLRNAPGVGRYRREVKLPDDWRGRAIHLVMEGVFHETTIFVDDIVVGAHSDGWTTIDLDLTEALQSKTTFTLAIDAVLPDESGLGRVALGETYAAKQDWYGLQGGIWKPARLEARSPQHIADLGVQTICDAAGARLKARGAVSQAAEGVKLRITLRRDGGVAAQADFPFAAEAFDCELEAPAVDLWSPESPALYQCECELIAEDVVVDAMSRAVGFRRFESGDGRLWLNGEPFYMFGALDQDWHSEEECRPPTRVFLEQRFRNAKALGLNTLRCHVKIPDKLYFELADELGLVVWLDMPYCEYLTPRARETVERVFSRSVVEHANHPSICVWTLFNEGWGIDLDDNPDDRRWLRAFFDHAKTDVLGSLVVDNSACFPRNYHVKTDIADFHWYNGFPHQTADFLITTEKFARRDGFPWSPHGDAVQSGDEALICSEFGVWGLPHKQDILEEDGSEPWWFESGHDWNGGAAYPHGIETRFRDAGLAATFGDLDGFVEAAQDFQFRGLKAQIEALRWERAISGYVITELNDTQWEANGLMDACNHPRRFASRLAELQTPWLVMARTPMTAVSSGQTFEIALRLVGPHASPPGSRIVWHWLQQSGGLSIQGGSTSLFLTAPASGAAQIADLQMEAFDGDGRSLSRNRLELCLVPPLAQAPFLAPLDDDAAEILAALRWPNIAAAENEAALFFATKLSGRVREKLLNGREVILIANTDEALAEAGRRPLSDRHNFPRMNLRRREGTSWDGRWMGAFVWRRTDGSWGRLPGGPLLDEHWAGLTPNYVLTSYLSTSHFGLVDAGVVVAWLHDAAAVTKRTRLGPGRLTVATFDFSSAAAQQNPLAPHVLAATAKVR